MMKRRAEKQAKKDQEKREANLDKPKQKQKTWRRDKNGNFIFKNKIRFSYVGIFVMIIVSAGLVFFGYGVFQIHFADFCNTEFIEGFSFACGFTEQEGVVFVPENERDFAPPTNAVTEDRVLP
tara:strand:- start:2391 stop:2759 length:369 start_codon:yes stop_codon:yes gene_type:complete